MLTSTLRAYGWTLPLIILLGTISSAAEAVGIGLFLPVLDPAYLAQGTQALHPGPVTRMLKTVTDLLPHTSRMSLMVAIILCALLLKASISYLNAVFSARKNLQISHELRSAVFSRILNSGQAFVSRNDCGKLLDVLGTETWRSAQALAAAISLITSSCTIAVFGALLLLISWRLTLTVAVGMAVLSAALRWVTRPVTRHGKEAVRLNEQLGKHMTDGIIGIRTIEIFNLQLHLSDRFNRASERVRAAFFRVEAWSNVVSPCADISSSLLLLLLIVTSAAVGTQWPVLMVTVMMIYRLQAPFKQLENARVTWAGLNAASLSVTDLMERTAHLTGSRHSMVARPRSGRLEREIAFENVTFCYPGTSRPSLRRVRARIAKGKVTAVVGPSGSGKTTFLNLLCALYQPDSGDIWVDGVPLHQIEPVAWRERLALAGQDVHLFNTTVRENIRYGRLTASEAEVMEAARRAHADEFLGDLPQGYDTPVGDNGGRLSGGQRQRIALARAFLREPEILILDEATNALDSLTERWVQAAVETLGDGRTVVVAAHRFSTIQNADHVIVLDDGEVVEQGTPASLRLQNGLFARLYQLQTPEDAAEVA